MKIYGGILILALLIFNALPAQGARVLTIENQTSSEIINIFVSPDKGAMKSFFIRLDMGPNSINKIDNPECLASLRVDTGLEFWFFKQVNLAESQKMIFSSPAFLTSEQKNGGIIRLEGEIKKLVPEKGSRPVCGLDRFRPKMPMKDVCSILALDAPGDDNGAILTSLGFAGLVWAARLEPEQNGPVGVDSPLEHLELRRPLAKEELDKVLAALYKQGYVPWQAEFPGKDIDFAASPDKIEKQKLLLGENLNAWFANKGNVNKKISADAAILLAPAQILPALNNADSPAQDVQLFTINLKPGSNTLLVDVAAYAGNVKEDTP